MNGIMRAAAQVIARAKDVVSAAGRPCIECQCCKKQDAIIPARDFDALLAAVDEYYTVTDLKDMDDTLAGVGGDLKRDILRGA